MSATSTGRSRISSSFTASPLPYLLLAPQLIITLVFFVWPAGEVLWQSTQVQDAFGTSSEFVGLANFTRLFHYPLHLASFGTTLVFSALVTFPALFFATLMLPVEVRIFPTVAVVSSMHPGDTYAGLTLPLIASATATFLFRQFFKTLLDELLEAARIDGAGAVRFFIDVVLPLSTAVLFAGAPHDARDGHGAHP
jgi:ABC-type glycerol-3-phosphate transport system permease component